MIVFILSSYKILIKKKNPWSSMLEVSYSIKTKIKKLIYGQN